VSGSRPARRAPGRARGPAVATAGVARTLVLALTLAASGPPARAVTYAFQDYTCPLDGQTFTQGLPTPGHPLGSQLDLKPWGPVLAPAVLPVCPGSRFVLWKREFSEPELMRLRALIASPQWLAIRDVETDYFRIAKLRQWLGDDAADVAFTYLYATWEVDESPERYARYAAVALEAVGHALPGAGDRAPTLQLVALELERRLGRLDAARDRAAGLASSAAFADGPLHALLAQQRVLIDARDTAPHRIDPEARAPH